MELKSKYTSDEIVDAEIVSNIIQYSDNVLMAPDDLVKSVGVHFINQNKEVYEKLAKE